MSKAFESDFQYWKDLNKGKEPTFRDGWEMGVLAAASVVFSMPELGVEDSRKATQAVFKLAEEAKK